MIMVTSSAMGLLSMVLLALVTLLACSLSSDASRILLVTSGCHTNSHLLELVNIGETMASRGHEVYLMKQRGGSEKEQNDRAKKVKVGAIKQVEYNAPQDTVSFEKIDKHFVSAFTQSPTFASTMELANMLLTSMHDDCQAALSDNDFMNKLRDLKLDMAIVTRFTPMSCYFLIPHHLRIPYVSIGGMMEPFLGGSPTLPSFVPAVVLDHTDRMHFTQRVKNLLVTIVLVQLIKWDVLTSGQEGLRQKFAPDVSSYHELVDQSQLFFVSYNHILARPTPTFPNVIQIPSLNFSPAKLLSADMEKLVSDSEHGVIVVSFGSLASLLPTSAVNRMIDAFKRLKQTVIWRVVIDDKTIVVPSNVHVTSWLPQNDLLGHNNTRLFVTHCGSNGQHEAVYHGVPMIGFPLQPEQSHNAFRMQSQGFGTYLEPLTFTGDDLLKAIREVLDNHSYTTNIKKASAIMRDSPMTPRETVAYWIEHVIKHGHRHLRSHAMDLAWYEYFMVDVLAVVGAVLIVVAVVVVALLRCCCRCCKRRLMGSKSAPKLNSKKTN
jgi:UDP:flavonoid glycosyltransferase YjiC (YdhE family)